MSMINNYLSNIKLPRETTPVAGVDIRKIRTCERCKADVPLAKVKLYAQNENKNMVLCEPCCDILKSKPSSQIANNSQKILNIPKTPVKATSNASVPKITNAPPRTAPAAAPKVYQPRGILRNNFNSGSAQKADESKISNKPKMHCARCEYEFNLAEPKPGTKVGCPYCGKSDRLQRAAS